MKKRMRCAIYARVSTKKQETEMQLHDLRQFVRAMQYESVEYIEKASSVKHRPVFEQMLQDARSRKFDTILVWKVDRFARSMKQFVDTVLDLDRVGVSVRSVTQNVSSDQKDPMGKFVLGLFGLLAELERAMIVERVKAGVAEAKRQGKHCGRPAKVFHRDQAVDLRAAGMSWREIARRLGVDQTTVRRAVSKV